MKSTAEMLGLTYAELNPSVDSVIADRETIDTHTGEDTQLVPDMCREGAVVTAETVAEDTNTSPRWCTSRGNE